MKMKNVVFALLLAVATFSTTAIFSQNENNNDELSISNDQTVMDGFGRGNIRGEVQGVYVPD